MRSENAMRKTIRLCVILLEAHIFQEFARNSGIGYFDVMMMRQIPNNSHRPEMIIATKVQNLFLNLSRCSIVVPFRYERAIDQAFLVVFGQQLTPLVKYGSAYTEIPTDFDN